MAEEKEFDYLRKFYDLWSGYAMKMMEKTQEMVKGSADPEAYKKFYNTWVETMSEMVDQTLRSPIFAGNIFGTLGKSLEFQKFIDKTVDAALRSMRIPSLADFQELMARINTLEEKIDAMKKVVK